MRFGDERWLVLLWVVPLALGLAVWAAARARGAARRFTGTELEPLLNPWGSVVRRAVKSGLPVLALGLTIVALARPMWNLKPQEVRARGRDVVFVVDVSRSMLAEDLAPNRLERARLWIGDALAAARGDRVALVAFAGEAVVKSPLTLDYGFFRAVVQDLSPDSVTRGGTNIGDAIRLVMSEIFNEPEARYRDIILITDGEDHESLPVAAAEAAGAAGVRLIVLGIGSETQGMPIPITDRFGKRSNMLHHGQEVRTKLDGAMLREMAMRSNNGRYLHVGTGTLEMDSVYAQLIREAEQRETMVEERVRYQEQFQVFVAGAIALLVIESLVRGRRGAARGVAA